VRHVRPSQLSTVLNYPGHLCVNVFLGRYTECETCETIPNYPGLPQLSWPTFGVNVLWVACTECETCETIPNYPGLSSTILPTFGVNVFLGRYMHRDM
jgi:hypothetical protein